MDKPKDIYDDIYEALPPFFTRKKAVECLNGLFTLNSLNHATTRPGGPPVHHIGKRAVLRREEFVEWLKTKGSMFDGNAKGTVRGVRPTEDTPDGTGTSGGGNQEGS